ncbi:MAG TPA: hypothetical protein VJB94_02985 [Candidatus Nanoarchaeia archaeon]|nr:hypothetical protein [Candidatus Nanoarchaeia archaeon]
MEKTTRINHKQNSFEKERHKRILKRLRYALGAAGIIIAGTTFSGEILRYTNFIKPSKTPVYLQSKYSNFDGLLEEARKNPEKRKKFVKNLAQILENEPPSEIRYDHDGSFTRSYIFRSVFAKSGKSPNYLEDYIEYILSRPITVVECDDLKMPRPPIVISPSFFTARRLPVPIPSKLEMYAETKNAYAIENSAEAMATLEGSIKRVKDMINPPTLAGFKLSEACVNEYLSEEDNATCSIGATQKFMELIEDIRCYHAMYKFIHQNGTISDAKDAGISIDFYIDMLANYQISIKYASQLAGVNGPPNFFRKVLDQQLKDIGKERPQIAQGMTWPSFRYADTEVIVPVQSR